MRRVRERCNHAPYPDQLPQDRRDWGWNPQSGTDRSAPQGLNRGSTCVQNICRNETPNREASLGESRSERHPAARRVASQTLNRPVHCVIGLVDPGCVRQTPEACTPPIERYHSSPDEPRPDPRPIRRLSLHTHDFDKQWWEVLRQIEQHSLYEDAVWTTCELMADTLPLEQLDHLLEFRRKLKEIRPQSALFFDLIKNGQGNQDIDNHVDALVLLVFLSLTCSDELLPVLAEQLIDIASGGCPQGRTTRLAQVCMSLVPY
jgi:hypothetical protein